MAHSYSFGVEIEMIARPRQVESPWSSTLYYAKFAQALRDKGLSARADDLKGPYRKRVEEYTKGWWMTRDGSLSAEQPNVALEAVSPILYTKNHWRGEIEDFWVAQSAVSEMPDRSTMCGGHIHVSPGTRQRWTVSQLRDIAVGIAYYEDYIHEMLPDSRRDNTYCQRNTISSDLLQSYRSSDGGWSTLLPAMQASDTATIIGIMQSSHRVLWNMENLGEGKIGTIEFRGGRCLRGPVRTKRWIAFTIAYLHLLLEEAMCTNQRFFTTNGTADLYRKIRNSAQDVGLHNNLPEDFRILNETRPTARRLYPSLTQQDLPPPYESSAPSYVSEEEYRAPAIPIAYPERARVVSDRITAPDPPANDSSPGGAAQDSNQNHEGTLSDGQIAWLLVYFLQFVFAMTVAGLYSLNSDSNWVWAEITAVLSILISVGRGILISEPREQGRDRFSCFVDLLLCFFWLIVFGIFADMYISDSTAGRMQSAAYIDLVNWLLWLVTAATRCVLACSGKLIVSTKAASGAGATHGPAPAMSQA